ncbi:winged helix-turn-helix domain-containing protein [Marispirochaeta sp.]|uniref:helix-turn-helix transcriptional regulator n=1 Tax=Marispirochaeta sp. TaxID=2038653 RepID=UPI0029C6F746|nr:winged helix-turn-helix domain-containing protein [Marispirochaeta sp.]
MEQNKSGSWTFLTNHSHVLLCLLRNPSVRIRDIAREVNITERAVQRIIADLDEAGYIERIRDGRNNTYKVFTDLHLRHTIEKHRKISDLVTMVFGETQY